MSHDDDSHRVDVHVRRTARSDGSTAIAMTVFCPVRHHSVELDDCTSCQYCEGLAVDPRDSGTFLTCRIKGSTTRDQDYLSAPPRVPRETITQAARTSVGELMTKDVVCVEATLSLSSLVELFLAHNISGAPVVDGQGCPVGIVTKTDVLRAIQQPSGPGAGEPATIDVQGYQVDLSPGLNLKQAANTTVGSLMVPLSLTLEESAPIAKACVLMAYDGVHRIVVTSPAGRVVGVVSSLDILAWFATKSGYEVPDRAR